MSSAQISLQPEETIRSPDDKKTTEIKLDPDLLKIVFEKKENLFLTGSGGTGKSKQLRLLYEHALSLNIYAGITAPTGCAAFLIGGTTIHRFFKLGLADKPKEAIIKIILTHKDALNRIRDLEMLLVDEISMVSKEILELINYLLQFFKKSNRPLGGVQAIFSGDYCQLPPINGEFAFFSQIWGKLNFMIVKLTTPHRFADPEHFQMLQRIRMGTPSREDISKLSQRHLAYQKYIEEKQYEKEEIKPTKLYALKKDVERENLDEVGKLPGKIYRYICRDTLISKRRKGEPMTTQQNADGTTIHQNEYTEYFNSMIPSLLTFKVGAQVMLTFNLDVVLGLVNGARGVIVECYSDDVKVLFKGGLCIKISRHLYEYQDEKFKASRLQLPLILAYALTINKTQGITLDYAIMDMGPSIFSPAMAYVVFSRVRGLEGILISSFHPRKIYAHAKALKFEKMVDELIANNQENENEDLKEENGKEESEEDKVEKEETDNNPLVNQETENVLFMEDQASSEVNHEDNDCLIVVSTFDPETIS